MAVGLVTLGGLSGCTQIAQRSGSPVWLAPAGASNAPSNARKRLAQLAREAKDNWKEVLRDYNRWKATGDEKIKLSLPEKIRRAKASVLAVADGLDTEGLTPELNEKLAKADFDSVSEAKRAKVVRTIMEDLSDIGLSEDESQKLIEALMQQVDLNAKKQEILKHGGISSYLRHRIENINPEALATNSISYGLSKLGKLAFHEQAFVPITCSTVKNYCFYLIASALVQILTADTWDETYEAFFNFIWASFQCEELLKEYCGW
jgi:hypothetical protein